MPEKIDFHAKSDRDLLVMAVIQGNETVNHLELINGTLKNHENRLTIVEGSSISKPISLTKKQAAGLGGTVFIFGSFVAGVIERLL